VAPHSAWTLFGWPAGWNRARAGIGQTDRIAFRVRDEEELRGWMEHLRMEGISPSPVMDRTWFRAVRFRAPDGMSVELATDGPGFTVDEPADGLGRELRVPGWLAPRREEIGAALTPLD
jgi:glyoxalase family protein